MREFLKKKIVTKSDMVKFNIKWIKISETLKLICIPVWVDAFPNWPPIYSFELPLAYIVYHLCCKPMRVKDDGSKDTSI